MQGRSIGSKRFHPGEAGPQPTRASIYQEENTPLEWAAAHELHAQLAVPRRPAELHPRALRHGLIASQLGLPMLARAESQHTLEAWEQPGAWPEQVPAASSGEVEHVGLDWPSNEQTTRYDEWELQKELVTYEETYPGYDPDYEAHPRLDFQLPPLLAAGYDTEDQRHELDYAQAAYAPAEYDPGPESSPGSYPYTHGTQPSAARWHSEQPIRRIQADNPPRSQQPQTTPHTSAHPRHARPQITTQSNLAARHETNAPNAASAQSTRTLGTTQRGAASTNEPRTTTQSFTPHAHYTAHASGARAISASESRTITQSFTPHAHYTAHASGARAISVSEPRTATQTSFAPHVTHAPLGSGYVAQGQGARSVSASQRSALPPANAQAARAQPGFATSAHHGAATHGQVNAGVASHGQRQGAFGGATPLSRRVRPSVDDEPVVYPHGASWLKRLLLLAALAGAAYAGQHCYFNDLQRAPARIPTPPPPAPPTPVEPPAQPAATAEPSEAPTPSTPPTAESAKERRSAARAALIAERWRERHARRGRDDDSTGDDRGRSPRADNDRSARAHDDYVNDRHAAAQSGTLRINSLPWSQVHVDGQLVGHTPQMNLLLPAGKHRVTLVNNEQQLSKTLTVQITPGNVTSHTVNLAE